MKTVHQTSEMHLGRIGFERGKRRVFILKKSSNGFAVSLAVDIIF